MFDIALQLRRFALDLLERLSFAPLLLARLVIGVVFVQSGWGKLHSLDNVIQFFTELGIPYPAFQAPFASGTELVCGALVLIGLGTRVFSVPLIITMIVAIATAVWKDLGGVLDLSGAVEFLYIALLAQLVVFGPGAFSVDALLVRAIERAEAPVHHHGPATKPARA